MRNVISLNEGWKFIQEDAGLPAALPADWQDVTLPHSWNAVDGMDGNGSFTRGTFWYARNFAAPKQPLPGGRVYVQVNAAGQQADVYVNGEKVAHHEGGYSKFRADVTDFCKDGEDNLLVIACSNERLERGTPAPHAPRSTRGPAGGLRRPCRESAQQRGVRRIRPR